MKSNICFVSLNNDYTKLRANEYANANSMFYADIAEMLQFDLIDVASASKLCGEDYIKNLERKKIKQVCTFENTCISVDYAMLNDDVNYKNISQNCTIIFLDMSKALFVEEQSQDITDKIKNKLDVSMYASRREILISKADKIIKCRLQRK